jgi:hypothetical protein
MAAPPSPSTAFVAANRVSVILFTMSRQRTFPDTRLIERNPRLDVDALHRAGALHAGEISSWACAWLTVKIEAATDWIVIDGDQRVALARDEILNGRYVRVKFLCSACNRGCRVLHHAQGWICRRCALGRLAADRAWPSPPRVEQASASPDNACARRLRGGKYSRLRCSIEGQRWTARQTATT